RPAGATATAAARPAAPDLTLAGQTQWVTPAQPGFTLALAVGGDAGPAADLHVAVTVYNRIDNRSEFEQAAGAVPDKGVLARLPPVPVADTPTGAAADTCVTVLPDAAAAPPTPGPAGTCAAGAPTVVLGCQPGTGTCDDVYPVSVALLRTGDGNPLERFTTFLTYEEPGVAVQGSGGPLRVAWIVPVGGTGGAAAAQSAEALVDVLAAPAHHATPATLDVSPTTIGTLATGAGRDGRRALQELAALTTAPGTDQLLSPSYVPVNVAALSGAGLVSEIPLQLARGAEVLHAALLHPSAGPWLQTGDPLSSADASNLTTGLAAAHASELVLDDTDLSTPGNQSNYTFAQPFTLPLAHGDRVTAAATDDEIDARFVAEPGNPVLAATQLVAGLAFIHFENEFLTDPRGVVLVPPAGWHPSPAFVDTLLAGLGNTQILSPVTLDQLFAQVPQGGNDEPATRHLQSGSVADAGGFSTATTARIVADRARLGSFATAVSGHPAVLTALGDQLLGTQVEGLGRTGRSAALDAYDRSFDRVLSGISLASEGTITFTSRTAYIPITVLSSAPYTTTVVMTLSSDKFTFPRGATRTLVLAHATTSVRVPARARTSGDHLLVTVTLRAPDGALTIAQGVVTVHSTSISLVGVALTVLAGLVLLVWWARTWSRSRRRRPRAH
ncbi:MAG: DUF6049 family protein, partial [Acidimicrobiales bacterium]